MLLNVEYFVTKRLNKRLNKIDVEKYAPWIWIRRTEYLGGLPVVILLRDLSLSPSLRTIARASRLKYGIVFCFETFYLALYDRLPYSLDIA
jgi:hypothetical protein